MLRRHLIIVVLCALGAARARADTLLVPKDFPTIRRRSTPRPLTWCSSTAASTPGARQVAARQRHHQGQGQRPHRRHGLGAGLTVDGQDLRVIGLKVISGTDGMVIGGANAVVRSAA
jgi:hypothetical protein